MIAGSNWRMGFAEINLMLRAASMALLLLLALILLRDHRRTLPTRMLLLVGFGVVCHLVFEMPGPKPEPGLASWLLFAGESSMFGSFWLFARAWFDDEPRFGWKSWLILLASVIVSLINFGANGKGQTVFWLTDIPMRMIWIGFPLAGLWIAWRGRGADLVEARRRLRATFIGIVGIALMLITVMFFIANLVFPQGQYFELIWIIAEASILFIIGALCLTLLSVRQADLFAANTRPKPTERQVDDPASEALAARLQAHMTETRIYRNEGLTIAALAAQLGEQEYRLRRLINARLGYRNFPAFLNSYRLGEVREALADPEQREVPILTIALDAGFGSLAPFNRAFREAEGMTPSEYRAKRR